MFLIDDGFVVVVVVADEFEVAIFEVGTEFEFEIVVLAVGVGVFDTAVGGLDVGVDDVGVAGPVVVFWTYWVTRDGGLSRLTLFAKDRVRRLAVNWTSTFDWCSPLFLALL